MEPNQPQNNDNFFFLNEQHQASQSPLKSFSPKGNSLKTRLILVAGSVVVLLIIFAVVNGILSGSKNANNKNIINVVEYQAILIQMSDSAATNSRNLAILNLAATTKISMKSSQSQFVKLLGKNGFTVTPLEVAYISPSVKTTLTSAVTNGTFDSTFISTFKIKNKIYQNDIDLAFKGAKSSSEKTMLKSLYDQSKILNDAVNNINVN
ncbi:MAG: hypothetical protein WCG30_00550 [Candidatus Saccharibacteria bacterium]